GAVAALEIVELDLSGVDDEQRVLPRDAVVVDHHVAGLAAADEGVSVAEGMFLRGAALLDDENEHANLRSRGRRRYHSRPPQVSERSRFDADRVLAHGSGPRAYDQ